jgi:hypothetical protein
VCSLLPFSNIGKEPSACIDGTAWLAAAAAAAAAAGSSSSSRQQQQQEQALNQFYKKGLELEDKTPLGSSNDWQSDQNRAALLAKRVERASI